MQKRILFFLFLFLTIPTLFAQQDGFWDKDRATNREIIVNARDRIVVKSESLPIGTTEIVYRITVLDENQQLANSLASVLKAIPDPTGISQGSAGALFLLSKVSGDDRCKYAIYTNPTQANAFKENGKIDAACLYQNNPVSKDAKVLSTDKSACLQSNPTYLWFAFESDNWILNQKIILEIVPWVDTKLSRGWHLQNRKKVINYCKTTATAKGLQNPDEYCVCMLDKIQKEYKYQEFQTLMDIEKNNVLKKNASQCLVESGANTSMNSNLRSQAALLAKQGKYGEAINKLNAIIQTNTATVSDYNNMGSYYLYTKQYDKAVKFLKEGERFDDSELLIKLNLAHAYLLNDNYREAKIIYKKYQTQNVTDSLSWTDKIKLDFEAFQKAGIQNDDYKRVLKLIEK